MSNIIAQAAIERMHHQPVMVEQSQAMTMANNLSKMARAEDEDEDQSSYERRSMQAVCSAYGFDSSKQNKPYPYQNGVAVIPIHGTLINRFGSSWGYVTGYNYIQRMRNLAMADSDVQLIVYDVHSGGGEVSGAFETAKGTFEARGEKPQIALVDHGCYSAAYMQAVAADKIYVTPTGGAGSIGVYTMHVDMSGMLEQWGIKIELIHSGDHKVDGHPFAALPDEVRADIQARVDKTRTNFVNLVAEYRNLDAEVVRKTEGRCYDADAALELGLIDGIATPAEAIQLFFNQQEDTTMSDKEKAAATGAEQQLDASALKAEGAATERQRIAGILGSEEAKDRAGLASHIAFKTSMSVDDAKGMLAAAPTEKVAQKADEPSDPLADAMAKTEQPNISADAGGKGKDTEVTDLMQSFQAATGRAIN